MHVKLCAFNIDKIYSEVECDITFELLYTNFGVSQLKKNIPTHLKRLRKNIMNTAYCVSLENSFVLQYSISILFNSFRK